MLLVLIALVAPPLGVSVNLYRAEQRAIAEMTRMGASIESEPGLLGRWSPTVDGAEAHGGSFMDEGLALLAGLSELR